MCRVTGGCTARCSCSTLCVGLPWTQSLPEERAVTKAGAKGSQPGLHSVAAMSSVTLQAGSMPSLQRSRTLSSEDGSESGQPSGEMVAAPESPRISTASRAALAGSGQDGRIIEEMLHALHRAHTVSADRLADTNSLRRELEEVRAVRACVCKCVCRLTAVPRRVASLTLRREGSETKTRSAWRTGPKWRKRRRRACVTYPPPHRRRHRSIRWSHMRTNQRLRVRPRWLADPARSALPCGGDAGSLSRRPAASCAGHHRCHACCAGYRFTSRGIQLAT